MESRIVPRPENIIYRSGDLIKDTDSNAFVLNSQIRIEVNTRALVLVYSFLRILQPQRMSVAGPMLPVSSNTMPFGANEPSHQILFRAPYSEDISVLQMQYGYGGTSDGATKTYVTFYCRVELPESYAEIDNIEMRLNAGAIIVE